jgi:tRNA pseudouridine32 synthase/23S rRNA pseudouridine746 synthase
MQVVPGEPNAFTTIERIRHLPPAPAHSSGHAAPLALYRLTPHTGRKHQLRAQMNALGLPIVGDRIYPTLLPQPPADAAPDWRHPLQLLARSIAFTDPLSGQPRRFTSHRSLQWNEATEAAEAAEASDANKATEPTAPTHAPPA